MIPFDSRKPMDPSGIRLGTPAITTRGMKADAAEKVAMIIIQALKNHNNETTLKRLRAEVKSLCEAYPIP